MRKGLGLSAIGSALYVWGGCAATCADVLVHVFDTRKLMWSSRNATSGAPPLPREGHVQAVMHGRLLILGGCDGQRGQCHPNLYVYDPIRDRWTNPSAVGAALPSPRQGAVHVVIGSEMLMYGGCSVKGSAAVGGPAQLAGSSTAGEGLCTSDVWSMTVHFTSLDAPAVCPRNCSGNGLCHRGVCACAPGFAGYGCELEARCHSNCSSHGLCVHGQCFCDLGYGGEDCSLPQQCEAMCSAQGVCRHGQCFCDAGYSGANCSIVLPCQNDCSGRGLCVHGACYCEPAYTGPGCELDIVCPHNCSSHGSCREGRCSCEPGWTGEDCATALQCPNGCSGNGLCANGRCYCNPGFLGLDCYEKTPCPR